MGACRVEAAQAGAAQVDRLVFPHRRGAAGQDREGGLDVDRHGARTRGGGAGAGGADERCEDVDDGVAVAPGVTARRRPLAQILTDLAMCPVPPVSGGGYGRA